MISDANVNISVQQPGADIFSVIDMVSMEFARTVFSRG